jgi:ribosome maturation factor RimP
MFASHLSRSLVSAGRPRLASSSRGVGALCANANLRARHASAAVSTSALADARERQAPRGWSAASSAREARARARLGIGLVPRVSAPARPWRDVTTHAKKKSDAGAPADVDAGDDGFDEDFDAFADDELMQTNEAGEALAEGDADIAADEAIFTAGTDWGEMALASMTRVLRDDEFDGALAIFSFKVSVERRRVYVSVDALRDKFGSPTLDQLGAVSRKFNADLEENGFPEDVALEVASPGAERRLRLPDDLARFAELPMRVTYADRDDENEAKTATRVMLIEDIDVEAGVATWKLADVEENRPQAKKGQGMNKKQREWRLVAPFDDVVAANLFVGF